MGEKRGALEYLDLVVWTRAQIQATADAGADFNARGSDSMSPLMWAAMFNTDPEVIRMIVAAGADIDARDDFGFTPLMFAADFNQNPEVILTLLAAGADAKARDRAGKTAFENAQLRSRLKGTRALRELERASPAERAFEMAG